MRRKALVRTVQRAPTAGTLYEGGLKILPKNKKTFDNFLISADNNKVVR
jgi:hypothetical protein